MSPIRIVEVLEPGCWNGPIADHVTLDYEGRHRRRIVLTTDHGARILLDLPHSRLLPGGAGLMLEDGRKVMVIAAREPLMQVQARDASALLRLAWHIGNRHLAAQIEPDRILIRRDPVIAAMLRGLGARLSEVEAPFDPEGGAYGGAHQAHDHGHPHAHSHDHDHHHHEHAHEP
ncbi:MAG TPA: urease accessory protein UreE [Caulobacteraceae bacterium]|nr:urease accessory protein UreE [Caulobacteraceae bacterium]